MPGPVLFLQGVQRIFFRQGKPAFSFAPAGDPDFHRVLLFFGKEFFEQPAVFRREGDQDQGGINRSRR